MSTCFFQNVEYLLQSDLSLGAMVCKVYSGEGSASVFHPSTLFHAKGLCIFWHKTGCIKVCKGCRDHGTARKTKMTWWMMRVKTHNDNQVMCTKHTILTKVQCMNIYFLNLFIVGTSYKSTLWLPTTRNRLKKCYRRV
jgi:hypothetical protein